MSLRLIGASPSAPPRGAARSTDQSRVCRPSARDKGPFVPFSHPGSALCAPLASEDGARSERPRAVTLGLPGPSFAYLSASRRPAPV